MKITVPEWLPDDVLFYLRTSPGKRRTRQEIARFCGLKYDKTHDRYIRESIRLLRADGFPIVSTSGQAGYSYDPDRVDEIIADLESRIIDLSATIRALKKGHVKNEQMKLEIG